jgi:hypothetical protein
MCSLLLSSGCQRYQRASESQLDVKCRELAAAQIEELKQKFPHDYLFHKTNSFYSKTIQSCIYTEVPETSTDEIDYKVSDLSHSLLKDPQVGLLLHCDKDGADSVNVDKVRALGGYVFTVTYSEWLDDGFGGPPRTLNELLPKIRTRQ